MKKHMNIVDFKWLKVGYCVQSEHFSLSNAPFRKKRFYATVGVIYHTNGIYLYDTGYSSEFYKQTKKFPFSLYAKSVPVFYQEDNSLIKQLSELGIQKEDIKGIILSHFHADHIAGLKELPSVPIYVFKKCYKQIRHKSGIRAALSGFVPNLLPTDFEKRVVLLEDNQKADISLKPFEKMTDILNDGSLFAVCLDGHADGQLGLYINMDKPVFLISDASWSSEGFKKNILPPWYVRFFLGNNKAYQKTLEKIYQFHLLNKDVLILPSHCSEYWEKKNV